MGITNKFQTNLSLVSLLLQNHYSVLECSMYITLFAQKAFGSVELDITRFYSKIIAECKIGQKVNWIKVGNFQYLVLYNIYSVVLLLLLFIYLFIYDLISDGVIGIFPLVYSFWLHYGPGVHSASNKN